MSEPKSYILPAQDKTEVYVGTHGHIIIKQDDMGGQENVVAIQPLFVPRLIEMLNAVLKDAPAPLSEVTETSD